MDEDFRYFNLNGYDMKVFRDGRIEGYDTNHKKWRQRKCWLNNTGYLKIDIRCNNVKYRYYLHNIITLCYLGKKPDDFQTDHINNNKLDNRLENLQYISRQDNLYKRVNNKFGVPIKGYTKNTNGTFKAEITLDGKKIYLGTYKTEKEARRVYVDAKLKYHKIKL